MKNVGFSRVFSLNMRVAEKFLYFRFFKGSGQSAKKRGLSLEGERKRDTFVNT